MSLMLFPSGSCIPSVLVTLPLWMLTSAHFSIPNYILMSLEAILTVWTNVSISLAPLPNSLMSSMNIRWLILLPFFLSWYPTSILSRTLVIGIIATEKSSGDSESLWKIPLLMLTFAILVLELFNCLPVGHCVLEESDVVFLCTVYFQALYEPWVWYHVKSLLVVYPHHGQVVVVFSVVHYHHFVNLQLVFGASALPSTTFLLVRYDVFFFQIVVQLFTDDACQ